MMISFIDDLSIIKNTINNNNDDKNKSEINFDFDQNFNLNDVNIDVKKSINNNIISEINNNIELNISFNSLFNSHKNNKFNTNLKKIKICKRKRLKKEDLNNIPLPIFSCIYCSNDYLSFKHLSNEIISNKYLFQTSLYDIKMINYLIEYRPGNDKINKKDKLLNIFIDNSEYLKKFYEYNKIQKFFKLDIFKIKCFRYYLSSRNLNINKFGKKRKKIINDFHSKGVTDILKIKNSNKSSFNLYHNIKNREMIFFKNDRQNSKKNKNELKILIEDNSKIKINKNDIEWEKEYYNVFDPIINDDVLSDNKENNKININKNFKNHQIYNLKEKIDSNKNTYIKINKHIDYKPLSSTNTNNNFLKLSNISFINSIYQNLLTPNSDKKEKNMKNINKTPLYSKNKLKNLYSRSEKKLIKSGKKQYQKYFKNNILIKYSFNNKKQILSDKALELKIKGIANNNKKKTKFKNLYNFINNSYSQSNKINILQNFKNNNNIHKKENLLTKTNNNLNSNFFNKSLLLNKSLIENKNIQNISYDTKFNLFLKNNYNKTPIKYNIQNSVYKKKSFIHENNNAFNINFYENDKNIFNNISYGSRNSKSFNLQINPLNNNKSFYKSKFLISNKINFLKSLKK